MKLFIPNGISVLFKNSFTAFHLPMAYDGHFEGCYELIHQLTVVISDQRSISDRDLKDQTCLVSIQVTRAPTLPTRSKGSGYMSHCKLLQLSCVFFRSYACYNRL